MSEYNYLDLISIFYNEKHLYLTDKKHKQCNDCPDHKTFFESPDEIIFNCGDTPDSKCGDRIRITLPIYKSDKDLLHFKNSLENSINWEVIGKYIDVDSKDKENNIELKKKI